MSSAQVSLSSYQQSQADQAALECQPALVVHLQDSCQGPLELQEVVAEALLQPQGQAQAQRPR